jgi:Asp-tRNA(Asn)/Glu-tRNA(Gln) amidotransferase A subunit family amidase
MTRTALDAQVLLEVLAGPDAKDPVSMGDRLQSGQSTSDLRGLRVGVARPQPGHEVSDEVAAVLADAVEVLQGLGCLLVDVELPSLDDARTCMWTISSVEGADFHLPMLREANDSYSEKARRLLLGGALVSGLDYARCQRVRSLLADGVGSLFDNVAIVLSPVLRSPAWEASRPTVDFGNGPEDNMSAMTHFSPLFNLTGHPAATFLGGFTALGLPVGLQAAAPLYREARLTSLVSAFEQATGYSQRRPQLG